MFYKRCTETKYFFKFKKCFSISIADKNPIKSRNRLMSDVNPEVQL